MLFLVIFLAVAALVFAVQCYVLGRTAYRLSALFHLRHWAAKTAMLVLAYVLWSSAGVMCAAILLGGLGLFEGGLFVVLALLSGLVAIPVTALLWLWPHKAAPVELLSGQP